MLLQKILEMNRIRKKKSFLFHASLLIIWLTDVSLRKIILAYWLAFNVILKIKICFWEK